MKRQLPIPIPWGGWKAVERLFAGKEEVTSTVEGRLLAKAAKVANIILGGGGLFCALVLFYLIYYYAWSGERSFSSSFGPIVYYLPPATLATLLFASLGLRPSHRVRLALLLLSTGISIYAAELWLVFSSFPPEIEPLDRDRMKIAKESGIDFDPRTRLEVVIDSRKKGVSAVPVIPPSIFLKETSNGIRRSELTINGAEILPLTGMANRTTVFCNESGKYLIYESDEHGFHNPKGIWNAARIDVAALGDSFTHGACVPSDKNFVALIRKRYPITLNLGSNGVGPLLMLAILKEYLHSAKPKIVLWFYYEGNDLEDLRIEKNSPLLMRYIKSDFSQGLIMRQTEIDHLLTAYVESKIRARDMNRLLNRSADIIKLNSLRQRLGLVYGASGDEEPIVAYEAEMNLFGKILRQAKADVDAWGGALRFIYLPDWPRYARPTLTSKNRDRVLSLARTVGLPVIDIHRAFQAQNDPLAFFPFRLEGHYNEAGHRVVAREVLKSISLEPPFKSMRS